MFSSVQNNIGVYSGIPNKAAAKGNAALNTGFQTTYNSSISAIKNVHSTKPAISSGAVPTWYDFNYNNIDNTQEEFAAYHAKAAREISASQGLPEGQYDFTRISAKQASIIMNDATLNHGAGWAELSGSSTFIGGHRDYHTEDHNAMLSDVPANAIAVMQQQIDYYRWAGIPENVALFQRTLDWMKSLSDREG